MSAHGKKSTLSERLRIIQDKTKKTTKSKTKKGVRVKQKKFSPLEALKILGFGK